MNYINESGWSKDFDFIEESCGYSEPLKFTEVKEDIIVESEIGKPSTYKILGKASGVFQTVGGYSRNKRYYTPEHWKIQLDNPSVQERLAQRDIMGTLGHSADRPINDDDIAKGLVSHLVTKLEIKEDANGTPFLYGELEILDTPAGKILKALYEGGANLFVSSRGAGKLEPMPEQLGIMRVNPHSYWFEGFDIVRRAGFVEAKPVFEQVKESTNESVNEEAIDSEGNTHEIIKTIEKDSEHPHRLEHKINGKTVSISKNDFPVDVKREEEHIKKAYNITTNEASNKEEKEGPGKFFTKDQLKENEEISTLKSQVEQLALVIEKVVDSLYEKKEPNINEDKAALGKFVELMADTNISEEAFEQVIEIIKKGI